MLIIKILMNKIFYICFEWNITKALNFQNLHLHL